MVAFGFGNAILTNLVKERFVADLQKHRGLLAVPLGVLESLVDGLDLDLILETTSQRLQVTPASEVFREAPGANWALVPSLFGVDLTDCERFVTQNQVTLHEIIQLAQITRPGVSHTGRTRVGDTGRRPRVNGPQFAMKCSSNSGISFLRSRSGGMYMVNPLSR